MMSRRARVLVEARHLAGALAAGALVACSGDPTGPTQPGTDTRRISVGESTVCAMHSSGTVYCWGDNTPYQQFGEQVPGKFFVAEPYAVALANPARLAGGSSIHMCAITPGGGAMCWGRASHGQLGSGSFGTPAAPTMVAGDIAWSDIFVGRISTCGVSTAGVGYCWGSNNAGEIGNASIPLGTNSLGPVPVEGGLAFSSVVAGWRHSCGITTAGSVYCWGENTQGQLGRGQADSVFHQTPAPVAGTDRFVQLSLGGRHTCGITTDGRAMCWGENWAGQLGDGTASSRSVPTAVSGGHRFRMISTASGFAEGTGVTPTGQAQLAHTCALTDNGTPYCWGWNGVGQVGSGSSAQFIFEPVPVSGGLRLEVIGMGGGFSCGMTGDAVWCWGANLRGQLGNGGINSSTIPTRVAAPFQ